MTIDIIPFFIKPVVFHNVGISWMIQTKEKFYPSSDETFRWYTGGLWYNTTIFDDLHGTVSDYLFFTARQYRYELICSLHAYDKLHEKPSDKMKFGGGRSLPNYSTIDPINSLSVSIKFIVSCFKYLVSGFS